MYVLLKNKSFTISEQFSLLIYNIAFQAWSGKEIRQFYILPFTLIKEENFENNEQ